ncbi:MAG: hypothetical protein R6X20_06720 [Phycisphaerae bacterium]
MTPGPNNTAPADDDGRAADGGSCSADATFHALACALTDQLDAARRGRVEEVAALADRVDALLAEARRTRAALSEAERRTLLDLHGQVRLALAQQQMELADRRERLRRGKRGTRAYAASGGSGG